MNQEMPDFDILLQIAQEDPQQLERLRLRLAHKTINSAPKSLRKRLRGLQFQIDAKRATSKTPLAACIHISNMMHQSFEQLRKALNDPPKDAPSTPKKKNAADANIIPFPNS
ncbi:MAG: DUF3135 domain-containing protein [Pseudomonadales bacterium]